MVSVLVLWYLEWKFLLNYIHKCKGIYKYMYTLACTRLHVHWSLSSCRAGDHSIQLEKQCKMFMDTCRTLNSHLQKISQPSYAHLEEEEPALPQVSPSTTSGECAATQDKGGAEATKPGGYILRRDKEQMFLIPSSSSLTRKRSKKEKRKSAPTIGKVCGQV